MKRHHKFLTTSLALSLLVGFSQLSIADILKDEHPLGNNAEGVTEYKMTDKKHMPASERMDMHPANIQPAAGDEPENIPNESVYNRFRDDPFGDIEE